jgi:hypothetical protein
MTCMWVDGRFVGAVGAVLRLVCGLQAFTASRGVLMACGVPGSGGVAAPGRWSCPGQGQGRQAFAPKGRRDASGGACAASGLRSEGWPGHCPARVLLVVPARIPRRVVALRNHAGQMVSSRIICAVGRVPCDLTPSARRDWLRPPTRRGIRDLPSAEVPAPAARQDTDAGRRRTARHRTPQPHRRTGSSGSTGRPGRLVFPHHPVHGSTGGGRYRPGPARPAPHTRQQGRSRIPRRVGANRSPRRDDGVKSMPHPTATRPPDRHGMDFTPAARRGTPNRNDDATVMMVVVLPGAGCLPTRPTPSGIRGLSCSRSGACARWDRVRMRATGPGAE